VTVKATLYQESRYHFLCAAYITLLADELAFCSPLNTIDSMTFGNIIVCGSHCSVKETRNMLIAHSAIDNLQPTSYSLNKVKICNEVNDYFVRQ
jgi:hypothetical protein